MAIKWLILATLVAIANGQFPGFGNTFNKGVQSAGKVGANLPKIPLSPEDLKEFASFESLFNKTYATPELAAIGQQNFITNRLSILKFNDNSLFDFKLELNEFADLVLSEFNRILNGFKGGNRKDHTPPFAPETFTPPTTTKMPENVDWRERGGVSPVKHQGMCASCHAFSAAGAVEGHYFRKYGKLVEISPQNLLDCPQTLKLQSFGCSGGGYVDEDLKYIWKNPGVNGLGSYAYEGVDGKCRYDTKTPEVNITGYVEIPVGDEKALEEVVGTLGPVAVGIDASLMTFQFYKEGVYFDKDCKNKGENINHAVLVVGYGKEADGTKYWLVKNSYGDKWGAAGYIKIAKDKDNHCGIATSAVYPLV